MFTEENSNSTVIAHNGAGYDNKFILSYCLSKGLVKLGKLKKKFSTRHGLVKLFPPHDIV